MTKLEISIFACTLAACAGSPPNEHLAASMAAVKTAESAGASEDPQAALHLKLAKEQVVKAQEMIAQEEYEHADRMTLRASDDAELALTLAREAHLKRDLQTFAAAHPEAMSTAEPTAPQPAPSTPAPAASPASPGK